MLHHLWWFIVGVWIGSFFTLVMVGLMRRNSAEPKQHDEISAPHNQVVKIDRIHDAA